MYSSLDIEWKQHRKVLSRSEKILVPQTDTASYHKSNVEEEKYVFLAKKFILWLSLFLSSSTLTIESTIENVNASIDAFNARFKSSKVDSSPNDHHVNASTIP